MSAFTMILYKGILANRGFLYQTFPNDEIQEKSQHVYRLLCQKWIADIDNTFEKNQHL